MSNKTHCNAATNVISLDPQKQEVTESFSTQQISLTVLILILTKKLILKTFWPDIHQQHLTTTNPTPSL